VERKVTVSAAHPATKMARGRVVFWGINSSKGFSGGRYHAWLMSEAAAEAGWPVAWITNDQPMFLADLGENGVFPAHDTIDLRLLDVYQPSVEIPDMRCDVLVVVPHGRFEFEFYDNALTYATQQRSRVILLNFETANWFNALSCSKRDPERWQGWRMVSEQAAMILSSAAEGTGFAREFYSAAKATRFEHCWAPINSRVADGLGPVAKEKRVLVFTRFAHAEHKGADVLVRVMSEAMRGYTLVLVVGVGNPPASLMEPLETRAREVGAAIEIRSRLSERDKWRELKRASLVLFPSSFEGFGLPPVEAQYVGTPCVAFDLPVLREVSGDALSYVPAGDAEAMRERAAEVLQGNVEPSVLHARVEPVFRFDDYVKRVNDLLCDVMQVGRACAYNRFMLSQNTQTRHTPSELTTTPDRVETVLKPERDPVKPNRCPASNSPSDTTRADRLYAWRDRPWPSWTTFPRNSGKDMQRRLAAARAGAPLTANDGRIASLEGIHKGRIGWLCGNGPSVQMGDLERLRDEVTFGCNRVYLAYNKMEYRPTYLCSTDEQMIRDFGQEMVDNHPGAVLLVANHDPELRGEYTWFRMGSRTPLEFSTNVVDFVMPGGGTLITAIQIGFHMGIVRYYLYGMDHSFVFDVDRDERDYYQSATGDGNHFIPNYRSGGRWAPPVLWQVEGALLSCQVFLQQFGGWIRNATRGGKLEALSRVDFDQVAPPVGRIA
jgi:glycosyltransferase involved in cell wall biosynthesis